MAEPATRERVNEQLDIWMRSAVFPHYVVALIGAVVFLILQLVFGQYRGGATHALTHAWIALAASCLVFGNYYALATLLQMQYAMVQFGTVAKGMGGSPSAVVDAAMEWLGEEGQGYRAGERDGRPVPAVPRLRLLALRRADSRAVEVAEREDLELKSSYAVPPNCYSCFSGSDLVTQDLSFSSSSESGNMKTTRSVHFKLRVCRRCQGLFGLVQERIADFAGAVLAVPGAILGVLIGLGYWGDTLVVFGVSLPIGLTFLPLSAVLIGTSVLVHRYNKGDLDAWLRLAPVKVDISTIGAPRLVVSNKKYASAFRNLNE